MSEHYLVTLGKEIFEKNSTAPNNNDFVKENECNKYLNDLENTPHLFVLACLMDKQMDAERAWSIPYKVCKVIGSFDVEDLYKVSLKEYEDIFENNHLHRFNKDAAKTFYLCVKAIVEEYDGDASNIWANSPSSATVVYRFLQFYGAGIKISTMATNILVRDFHIPMSDYYSIDISPDVHIIRITKRTGLVDQDASREAIVYKAREMNPEFPGIIDLPCWEIGRTYCHPQSPNCLDCPITKSCKKIL